MRTGRRGVRVCQLTAATAACTCCCCRCCCRSKYCIFCVSALFSVYKENNIDAYENTVCTTQEKYVHEKCCHRLRSLTQTWRTRIRLLFTSSRGTISIKQSNSSALPIAAAMSFLYANIDRRNGKMLAFSGYAT